MPSPSSAHHAVLAAPGSRGSGRVDAGAHRARVGGRERRDGGGEQGAGGRQQEAQRSESQLEPAGEGAGERQEGKIHRVDPKVAS